METETEPRPSLQESCADYEELESIDRLGCIYHSLCNLEVLLILRSLSMPCNFRVHRIRIASALLCFRPQES